MPSYLKLEVGPYYLLVPTDEVFEVVGFTRKPGEDGFVVWRDEILPAVSMRYRLGLPDNGSGVMIVHGDDASSRAGLIVDKVLGLVELGSSDFQPLRVNGRSRVNFDQVWSDASSGRQALKVKISADQGREQCPDISLTAP